MNRISTHSLTAVKTLSRGEMQKTQGGIIFPLLAANTVHNLVNKKKKKCIFILFVPVCRPW